MPSYRQADNARTSKASSNCVRCGKGLKTVSLEGWHLDLDTWFPAGGNVLGFGRPLRRGALTWRRWVTMGMPWGLHWLCFLSALWFLNHPDVSKQPSTPATVVWAVSSTPPFPPCYLRTRSQGRGTLHPVSGFWCPCVRYSITGMREVPKAACQGWRGLEKAF